MSVKGRKREDDPITARNSLDQSKIPTEDTIMIQGNDNRQHSHTPWELTESRASLDALILARDVDSKPWIISRCCVAFASFFRFGKQLDRVVPSRLFSSTSSSTVKWNPCKNRIHRKCKYPREISRISWVPNYSPTIGPPPPSRTRTTPPVELSSRTYPSI